MTTDSPARGAEPIRLLLVASPGRDREALARMIAVCEPVVSLSAADDVEGALRILRESCFEAVLFGISSEQEPGLSGLAKARFATATAPVIAIARESEPDLGKRALRLGAQDYLVRSELTPELLSRTIHYAMERHHVLSELRSARLREHYLATHDALTALLNRAAFIDHLSRAVSHARRYDKQLAVLFIDVNGFKRINDTLGHGAGDQVLRTLADRLSGLTRESDACGRHGGDEFLMCLHGVMETEAAGVVARKLLEAIAQPVPVGGVECRVGGSIGIALYPRDGGDAETLIRRADAAMYAAKASGGNAFAGYPGDSAEVGICHLALPGPRSPHARRVHTDSETRRRRFSETESA